MTRAQFVKESFFSAPREELFGFHERPDAFELLTPEAHGIEVQSTASTLAPSEDVVRFSKRFLFLKLHFETVHTVYEPPALFVDEQQKGLFSSWRHEHRFREAGWEHEPASLLRDEIHLSHPLLPLFLPFVKHQLSRLFAHRHRVTGEHVHGNRARQQSALAGARVVVTGATGLIGRRVTGVLLEQGARVLALVRDVERGSRILGNEVSCVHWDFHRPGEGDWGDHLGRADHVIHLAGTPLFKRRWSASFKREMERSRVEGTRQLADAIIAAGQRPRSFVSASAVGIHGLDPEPMVDESSPAADDLLARICAAWENEARKLDAHGLRTVQLRIGIVLSRESGALKEIEPLFRAGLGGVMGHRHHFINWIHLEDVARILVMAAAHDQMSGPYNAVAPTPVQNEEFARSMARVMRRPCVLRYPTPLLKLLLGEAGEYASGGPRASSLRIQQAGYRFFFEDLETALRNSLGLP